MFDPNNDVLAIPVLRDNYCYIVPCGDRSAAVIDPGEAAPVLRVLQERGMSVGHILVTHYDYDHIGGISTLVSKFGCRVTGPEPAAGVAIDDRCRGGDRISVGDLVFDVIDTPGHAYPHVAYHEDKRRRLFSGDCLFGAGCGRVGANGYGDMYKSLRKLAALPGETRVFFGHEYTSENLKFARSVEPGNAAVEKRLADLRSRRANGGCRVPSTLAEEIATNPFLRTDSEEIREVLGLSGAAGEDVFTALRRAKNSFRG